MAGRRLRERSDAAGLGSTGCNRFVGSYTMSDSSLRFGSIATTRMACPGSMEQESAFEWAHERTKAT